MSENPASSAASEPNELESKSERRQFDVGWLGQVDEDKLHELIWDFLTASGADDIWSGSGPDKHPEDWEDSADE